MCFRCSKIAIIVFYDFPFVLPAFSFSAPFFYIDQDHVHRPHYLTSATPPPYLSLNLWYKLRRKRWGTLLQIRFLCFTLNSRFLRAIVVVIDSVVSPRYLWPQMTKLNHFPDYSMPCHLHMIFCSFGRCICVCVVQVPLALFCQLPVSLSLLCIQNDSCPFHSLSPLPSPDYCRFHTIYLSKLISNTRQRHRIE